VSQDQVKFSVGGEGADTAEVDEAHRPHQLFCEMDELQSNFEWKEAARWLKFEEDVENGGRWSKPHVATLSLHSLFELRSCLTSGAVLLDFVGEDITTIIGEAFFFSKLYKGLGVNIGTKFSSIFFYVNIGRF
jgi:hypothetical protein